MNRPLWERARSGRGQFLEISMMETLAGLHQFTFEMETYTGVVRARNGLQWNKQGPFAMYGITTLPCDDGYAAPDAGRNSTWMSGER